MHYLFTFVGDWQGDEVTEEKVVYPNQLEDFKKSVTNFLKVYEEWKKTASQFDKFGNFQSDFEHEFELEDEERKILKGFSEEEIDDMYEVFDYVPVGYGCLSDSIQELSDVRCFEVDGDIYKKIKIW